MPPSNRNEEAKRLLQEIYADLRSGVSSDCIGNATSYFSDDVAPEWQASLANILAHYNFQRGNFSEALEDYLRTVTLFYHDPAAVSVAQERADALRKDHKEVTVP